MYARFSDRARRVMQFANQEAQRFQHEYIGSEHILLGILKEGSGVAVNVLKNLDVNLSKIGIELERILQSGCDAVPDVRLPQTPRAKKVIEYSMEESHILSHNYVGTEHLLLGLLREREGVAGQVLMNFGLTCDKVREEIRNLHHPATRTNDDERDRIRRLAAQFASHSAIVEIEIEIQKLSDRKLEAIASHELDFAATLNTQMVALTARRDNLLQRLASHPSIVEIEIKIQQLNDRKENAIANQEFELAANVRDEAVELKKQRDKLFQQLGSDGELNA